jgi:hypothetical protein
MAKKKHCFSCGKSFNGSTKELLQYFKREYVQNGVERYFYRKEKGGDIYVINKDKFKKVFKEQIKPNFKKGAEYAHIKEYKAS